MEEKREETRTAPTFRCPHCHLSIDGVIVTPAPTDEEVQEAIRRQEDGFDTLRQAEALWRYSYE